MVMFGSHTKISSFPQQNQTLIISIYSKFYLRANDLYTTEELFLRKIFPNETSLNKSPLM